MLNLFIDISVYMWILLKCLQNYHEVLVVSWLDSSVRTSVFLQHTLQICIIVQYTGV